MSPKQIRRTLWAVAVSGVAVAAATPAAPKNKVAKQGPPVFHTGKLGQDLFLAIDHRDTAAVRSLLKNGADPNATNFLQFTPIYIAAASYQPDVVEALLSAGANPNNVNRYGTPLTFAAATGNLQGATRLLDLKADVNHARADGTTPLMMAANAGNPALVSELLKHKADPNAKNLTDATALTYAARAGHTEIGRMLLDAGAAIDAPDQFGQTTLMVAATNGHAEFVEMLLAKGAKPNLRDAEGRTALMLAATYGDTPTVAQALVRAGADAAAKDRQGRTAGELAASRGNVHTAELLGASGAAMRMRSPREAVNASLKMLEKSMADFTRKSECLSCHQEGLGRIATGVAAAHGFKLDPTVRQLQGARIRETLMGLRPLHEQALKNPSAMKELPLIEINELNAGDSWLLAGMASQNDPANGGTAAMAKVLAKQQAADGSWTFSLPRIPMQSSNFTYTALTAKSLAAYAPAEAKVRLEKAKAWLLQTRAKTGDDRAMRLLGLKWTGANMAERRKSVEELLATQNKDGGWSQVPGMRSDAYATGQALYALRLGAGMPASDPVYARGTEYLLRTQEADGTWFVSKRAIPVNNYFDGGFPHGESQYASFNGTCWAMMALLETMDRPMRVASKPGAPRAK